MLLACLPAARAGAQPAPPSSDCQRPCVGPEAGALLLAGGGNLGPEILERFVELAGGPGAHIVVIPTAAADDAFSADWEGLAELRAVGAVGVTRLTILHTRDRREADSEAFVGPLRRAAGGWIPGGRQGRLVDAYLGTRTQREVARVLERGGVVGGSSAGASMLASYLVRGGVATNEILMAPGYEEGFGLLRNAAVDQHVLVRNRIGDLPLILEAHPELLGIGLDEGAAIVVRGDLAEVVGRSHVIMYDPTDYNQFAWLLLVPGDVYDLGERQFERRWMEGESHLPPP